MGALLGCPSREVSERISTLQSESMELKAALAHKAALKLRLDASDACADSGLVQADAAVLQKEAYRLELALEQKAR